MFDGRANCFFVTGVALASGDVVVEPFPLSQHQISVNRMFYKQKSHSLFLLLNPILLVF